MEKINIAVCDDDAAFRKTLELELINYSRENEVDMSVRTFSNGLELLISEIKYDLIFLDYSMGILNGIEVAKKLRAKGVRCPIIYVTGYSEIVYVAFEVNAFRFIPKPVEPGVLNKALDDFIFQLKTNKLVSFVSDETSITIFSSEIVYVEGKFRGCIVHAAKKSYPVAQSFSEFIEGLGDRFYTCHRNISVNTAFIDHIDGASVILSDGRKLKVDKPKTVELIELMESFKAN
ncbi:MAG: LytR/AlgR family response regulator transcription factor [Oscillospiraceae bacterium]